MKVNLENNQKPVVSIILPTYNRGHLIEQTLDCIVNQSFENWECLIIDDGSNDNTLEVITPYFEDRRIKIFKRTADHEKGPSGCRNQGIDLSKGEYIVFFDSDDIVHPDALTVCIDLIGGTSDMFCNYNKEPFWGEWAGNFSKDSKFDIRDIDVNDIEEIVTQRLGFACCTVMWKKQAIDNERFNEKLTYAEEWEYYSRLLSQNLKGISISKTLYFNRKHPKSNTGEFWNNDPVRRASKVKAVELVINNLKEKELLSKKLFKYFIQLGFLFKQPAIINYTLEKGEADVLTKLKYKFGYVIYPILKPLFNLKSKIFKT